LRIHVKRRQLEENLAASHSKMNHITNYDIRFKCTGICHNLFGEETMASQPYNRKSHIPKNSLFFEKLIPVTLIVLGLITLGLMLFAAGVLLGIVHF
jgi:hypothetical protein